MSTPKPVQNVRLPYDIRLQIGKALDRLVCDDSSPEQVDQFIATFADFGLAISATPAPIPRAALNDLVFENTPPRETPHGLKERQPCSIPDPSTRDCPNMKEVGGGFEGERYRCDVCGKGYFLDYEDMK